MLFDAKAESNSTEVLSAEPEDKVTFSFNWITESYSMDNGGPVEISGEAGARAWLEQCIRTRRGAYAIYPVDYGCNALDLVGSKLHSDIALSEMERELQESARYCDEITSIGNVRYKDGVITMDVVLNAGNGLKTEVIEVVD